MLNNSTLIVTSTNKERRILLVTNELIDWLDQVEKLKPKPILAKPKLITTPQQSKPRATLHSSRAQEPVTLSPSLSNSSPRPTDLVERSIIKNRSSQSPVDLILKKLTGATSDASEKVSLLHYGKPNKNPFIFKEKKILQSFL